MVASAERRLVQLLDDGDAEVLVTSRRGIEKESLRVLADGTVSQQPHPPALGSALMHPQITTDFGEAQLELVTGVHESIAGMLQELHEIHLFVQQNIGDELLWPLSAPGYIGSDEDFGWADYGRCNLGRLKQLYRIGLAHRYSHRMQAVSGVHYNFSFAPDIWEPLQMTANDGYMGTLRNLQRHLWLLVYLFGATPVVDASYVDGRGHRLHALPQGLGLPHATCLRMSEIGYVSDAQASMSHGLNDLASYLQALHRGLHSPWPAFERIGVRDGADFLQMNTMVLQVENELYSQIRAKAVPRTGERLIESLRHRGIEYMELRLFDLNPFHPLGISSEQAHLIELLIWYCLLIDSPPISDAEMRALQEDLTLVMERGREADMQLSVPGCSPCVAGQQLLPELHALAGVLDGVCGAEAYTDAVAQAERMLTGQRETLSAGVLDAMGERHHCEWGLALANDYRQRHVASTLGADVQSRSVRAAEASLQAQQRLEAEDSESFEDYLAAYLATA